MQWFFDNRFQMVCLGFGLALPGLAWLFSKGLAANSELLLICLGMAALVPFFASKASVAGGQGTRGLSIIFIGLSLIWASFTAFVGLIIWQ